MSQGVPAARFPADKSPAAQAARAPSPARRRPVNKTRTAAGEGWGEGEKAAWFFCRTRLLEPDGSPPHPPCGHPFPGNGRVRAWRESRLCKAVGAITSPAHDTRPRRPPISSICPGTADRDSLQSLSTTSEMRLAIQGAGIRHGGAPLASAIASPGGFWARRCSVATPSLGSISRQSVTRITKDCWCIPPRSERVHDAMPRPRRSRPRKSSESRAFPRLETSRPPGPHRGLHTLPRQRA